MPRIDQKRPQHGRPLGPVPPATGLEAALRQRWNAVAHDPDRHVRPCEFSTPEPPSSRVDITPGGWDSLQAGQRHLHHLAAPPPSTDRLVTVGLLTAGNSRGPHATHRLVSEIELAPWAVWTLIEVEHPEGRRWTPPRRLAERRCAAGQWSIDFDALTATARGGWQARSASRTQVTVRGATYDVVVADVWRSPPPAAGLEPQPNWSSPG